MIKTAILKFPKCGIPAGRGMEQLVVLQRLEISGQMVSPGLPALMISN